MINENLMSGKNHILSNRLDVHCSSPQQTFIYAALSSSVQVRLSLLDDNLEAKFSLHT